MHRYPIWLGIIALLLAQWGCGDGQPSSEDDTSSKKEVSAPEPDSSPPPPTPPPPPPIGEATPPPPPDETPGEGQPGGADSDSASPPSKPEDGGTPEEVKDYNPKDHSLENLEQIGKAMLEYHKKNKSFPPAAHFGDGDKPLLSWRVLLLPYLGERDLYDQFKMNEPWDSPDNKPLADQIPEVYKTPDATPPETCYLVPSGMGTIFSAKRGIPRGAIHDGPENTLLVVEANLDRSVVWTSPEELRFVQDNPSSGIGSFRRDAFLAVTADGAAHYLPNTLNADLMRALFTASGKEDQVRVEALEIKPGEKKTGFADLVGRAKDAMLHLREEEGLRFLMAEAVVHDSPQVLGSLRWSPGLKRPVLVCRWGIALESTIKVSDEDMRLLRHAVGEPVVFPIEKRIREGDFGDWFAELAEVDKKDMFQEGGEGLEEPTGPKRQPGIILGGLIDAEQTKSLARKEGLDVLLIASLSKQKFPGKRIQSALTFRLYDVEKDTVIYRTEPLRITQVLMAMRHGESAVNPIDELLENLIRFVDAKLCLKNMPPLTRPQVQNRARSLVNHQYDNPLPALMELRYYAWKNLLTPDELARCYGMIVGETNGPILAKGNKTERLKVIRQWLPE